MNVFQKCNGVDGVAQHRILKRNRQDIIRSEIERLPQKHTASTILFIQTFDYENENLKDILFHTGVLVVYNPHRYLWVLFPPFIFVVIDSAVENHFVGGTLMAWRQTLPLHVDMSAAYITCWLKQTWIAGTQVMELHQRFLHVPLSYGQGVFLRIIKATIFVYRTSVRLFTFD